MTNNLRNGLRSVMVTLALAVVVANSGAGLASGNPSMQVLEEMAVGQTNTAWLSNCNKGLFIITNEEGYSLPNPIVKAGTEASFSPSQQGVIEVKGICLDDGAVMTAYVMVHQWLLQVPLRAHAGEGANMRVDGCNSGVLFLTNESGTPLPVSPTVKSINSSEFTYTVTPSGEGEVEAKAICFDPNEVQTKYFNVFPANLGGTTLEIRWIPYYDGGWRIPDQAFIEGPYVYEVLDWHGWHSPPFSSERYGIYTADVPKGYDFDLVLVDDNFIGTHDPTSSYVSFPVGPLYSDDTSLFKVYTDCDGAGCATYNHVLHVYCEPLGHESPWFEIIVSSSYVVHLPVVMR
jgi:hypothetical protein